MNHRMIIVTRHLRIQVEFPIHFLRRLSVDIADHRPDRGRTLEVRIVEQFDSKREANTKEGGDVFKEFFRFVPRDYS